MKLHEGSLPALIREGQAAVTTPNPDLTSVPNLISAKTCCTAQTAECRVIRGTHYQFVIGSIRDTAAADVDT